MPINQLHLRAFHQVAVDASFTRAARNLHITQPTLSEQVKALESHYGVSLFSRRGRSIALTPLGVELLEITRRLDDLQHEAELCLTDARELRHGRLRIGTDGPLHAMGLLAVLSERHPGIELSLSTGNSASVLADLLDHRVDVAVLANPVPDRRLITLPLLRDRLVAFVHVSNPLAGRGRISLPQLADQRLVIREPGSTSRRVFERALVAAGRSFGQVLQVDSREAVHAAVAQNLGVGVVSHTEFVSNANVVSLTITGRALVIVESLACLTERRGSRLVSAVFDAAG